MEIINPITNAKFHSDGGANSGCRGFVVPKYTCPISEKNIGLIDNSNFLFIFIFILFFESNAKLRGGYKRRVKCEACADWRRPVAQPRP